MNKMCLAIILTGMLSAGCVEEQAGGPPLLPGEKKVRVQSLKPRALIILEKGLTSNSARIRTNAIEVAVETRQKDMLPSLSKLTQDPTVPVRFAAVVALGDLRCFSCESIVRQSLNDPDVNVRIAAAYSLVKLNQPNYFDPLLAAAKSPDQTVRANAALLIGKLGNPEHIPLLYEVLTAEDSVDKVRMQAVESIARLGDERMYRSKLWALQISKYADDRVMGIRGMGALNTPEARSAIATMLQDDVLEVRLAAAEELARLGDTSGEEEVFNYFQTNPDLNKADIANGMAVMAIGYLESNRLNAYLPQILDSEQLYIQLLGAQSVLLQLK